MIGPDEMEEYHELLRKKQQEYTKRQTTELEPLLEQQVELIQALINVQTKIVAKLAGFKV